VLSSNSPVLVSGRRPCEREPPLIMRMPLIRTGGARARSNGVPDSCTGVRQASAICCAGNQDAGPVFSVASRFGRVNTYRPGRPNGIPRGR
jgi:hypothetical protein